LIHYGDPDQNVALEKKRAYASPWFWFNDQVVWDTVNSFMILILDQTCFGQAKLSDRPGRRKEAEIPSGPALKKG
jgi:hypothetical protein